MWLVADIFERYTTSVAKTFLKIAAREAQANQAALERMRLRRRVRDGLVAEASTVAPEPAALDVNADGDAAVEAVPQSADPAPEAVVAQEVVAFETAPPADDAAEVEAVIVAEEAVAAPVSELPTPVAPVAEARELPMGVRADVVGQWVEALCAANPRDVGGLVEKLRKDKKVRVPELQWIAANTLGEEPTVRKKADHLAVLRDHLGGSSNSGPHTFDGPHAMHA